MKEYKVEVIVDTNDADYVTEVYNVSKEKLDELKGIIDKIKPLFRNPKNPGIEEYDDSELRQYYGPPLLTEEELDILLDFIPVPEPGYSQLEGIKFYKIIEEEELL